MKRLIQTSSTPSGGYCYTQKETGQRFCASTPYQLVGMVAVHRRANNLPIPFNISDEVEMYICHERPELCHEVEREHNARKTLDLSLAVRLTKTLIAAGTKRVDQEEADRRAEICVSCPDNADPAGCSGCQRGLVKKAVEFIVGNNKTAYDSSLKSCKHCGCFNAAQVWIPIKALHSVVSEGENRDLPDHCWKKK